MIARADRRANPRQRRVHRTERTRFIAAVALAELSVMFALGGLVSVGENARTATTFGVLSVSCGLVGLLAIAGQRRPTRVPATAMLSMVTLNWTLLCIGGAVAHLAAGATSAVDVAILEGTAAATTTAMSALDPESMSRGMLLFRALSQWFGGLGAVALGMIVFPLLDIGRDSSARLADRRGTRALLAGRTKGYERAVALYGGFTMVLIVAFSLAGVSAFESLTHGLTVASTGGLSTRSGSIGELGVGAEWIAAVGMAIAGMSLVAVWWIVVRELGSLRRSQELRCYLGALVVCWGVLIVDSDGGVRGALTLAASTVSTTGMVGSTSPTDVGSGATVGLLVLTGIGAMAASAGGGLGWIRILEALGFTWRELVLQLHPNVVHLVKVDARTLSERTLDRANGLVMMYITTGGIGAILIALGDSDLTPSSAISLAIAALSTSGLQLIEPVPVAELAAPSRLVLAMLMLAGRISVAAILISLASVATATTRGLRSR